MTRKPTLAALALAFASAGAFAQTVVGVSWSNFQEERWKTDEAAMKAALLAASNIISPPIAFITQESRSAGAKGLAR